MKIKIKNFFIKMKNKKSIFKINLRKKNNLNFIKLKLIIFVFQMNLYKFYGFRNNFY